MIYWSTYKNQPVEFVNNKYSLEICFYLEIAHIR